MFHSSVWLALTLCAVAGLVQGCASEIGPPIPDDWQVIHVGDAFSFAAPPTVTEVDQQPVDSLVGSWRNAQLEITYDYGRYSSSLTEFDAETTRSHGGLLDGRPAQFIETPNLVAIHVPVVTGEVALTLIVRFFGAADKEIGEAVVSSIRFAERPGDQSEP